MNLTPDMTSIQALTSILRGEPRRLPAALILALLASLAEMVPWVALWLAARAVMVGDPVVGHSLMAGVPLCYVTCCSLLECGRRIWRLMALSSGCGHIWWQLWRECRSAGCGRFTAAIWKNASSRTARHWNL